MFKLISTIALCAGILVSGCTAHDEHSSDELDTVIIHVDESGPSTSGDLIEQSTVIVRATLDSITTGAGYRGGYNEDEPTSEFIELIKLNFSTIETLKGESPAQLAILWDGYTVKNVGGKPTERLNRVLLAGADFTSTDVGQSFVLFLTERNNSLDIITVTDGIAYLLGNNMISPSTTSGVLGIASEATTLEYIRQTSSSEPGAFIE